MSGTQTPILVFLISLSTLLTGCSATQSMRDWGRSLVSRDSDAKEDPLVLDKKSLSKEYVAGEKGLDDPNKTNLAFARWKEDMGQYSEAKARYQEVLTANPENLGARLGIARVEYETGRVSEARKILQDASERHPNSSQVWLELGRIHGEQERWDEAISSFQKAADIDSTDQVARYELGVALARSDRLQDALPHLKYSVGESAAMYNIGYVLHEQHRNAEAITWFNHALKSHPDERTKTQSKQMLARLGVNPDLRESEAIAERSSTVAPNPFGTPSQTGVRGNPVRPVSSHVQQDASGGSSVKAPSWSDGANSTQAIRTTSGVSESGRVLYSFDNTPQWRGPQTSGSANTSGGSVEPQKWQPN